ncbi:hypothetical protein [Deinococcus sp.]|uniref:hypothetical protein n=1 Tax=Deinococcus sp. TaxID=47478 RepID=UPI003CC5C89A
MKASRVQQGTPQQPGATRAALNAVWRARALRYLLIYLLLACVLVTLRYQTQGVYPELRRIRDERTALLRQRDDLSVAVQSLTSEQRVRAWAIQNGMVPYAQASKRTAAFEPPPPLPAVSLAPLPSRLEVVTKWK